MTGGAGAAGTARAKAPSRAPAWLIITTGVVAVTMLMLAVAETNLKAHYFIDQGEFVSMFGLAFILVAALFLYRRGQLFASLPLVFPWLLYPIITQGDQIIDNLQINPMRAICHVLLAAIFATPVAVIVVGLGRARGRPFNRAAATRIAAGMMAAEIWLAYLYLGLLMIVTLVVMIAGTLIYGALPEATGSDDASRRNRSEHWALAVLVVGFAVSLGTYVGYKNQPGAYQGSPSFFMDPAQQGANYSLDRIPVPTAAPLAPASPEAVAGALTAYARTLERLLAGYHILDRNYTYDFHNALFMRHTPLVPDYRAAGLQLVDEARTMRADADVRAAAARASLRDGDPLAALLDDVRAYVAFNFERAPVLERLSAQFERTPAGLQHAAHLYEGEGKYLGTGLAAIAKKYQAVIDAPAVAPATSEFASMTRSLYDAYAHHVVGF
jgi:hypothetical protein